MAETNIKSFNYEAFAKDLSGQAREVIPPDIENSDCDFVVDIIYRFCQMAGEALVKEENSALTAQEASLVTQFIGEWIFHKSIDLIRAGIDEQYRESVLQKVAFTVFDIAKKAVEKKIPQDQLINLVENQVKKCFTKAIEELASKGILSEEDSENALSQSNIDAMAATQAQTEIQQEEEHDIAAMSDSKIIKLASLAILMKNFPSQKIKNILQKFNKPEREVLLKYLKMPDLEEKLDMGATIRCFDEIKSALPEVVTVSYDKAFRRLCKTIKKADKNKVLEIIKDERPAVRDFVLAGYNNKKRKIPATVADVISKYLEEKV